MSAPGKDPADWLEGLDYLTPDHLDALAKAQDDNNRYRVEVVRDTTVLYGVGRLYLWDNESESEEPLLNVPLVTGGHRLDPARYGGTTPPITWGMVELIEVRDHPHVKRHHQHMARIHPLYEDEWADYDDRSYETTGDHAVPFMIHAGGEWKGSSTGCLAILRECWREAVEALNMAWKGNGGCLGIIVREQEAGEELLAA